MRILSIPLLVALLIAGASVADEVAQPLKPQTKCPIMGGPVNKALYADVEGQRIYVCCQGCIAAIKADPDKAFATLQKNGEYAETRQTTCPVMTGNPINPKLYVEYQGRRIYVCCKGCVAKVTKDPAKYAAMIAPDEMPAKKE